jgi:hypothetical protein
VRNQNASGNTVYALKMDRLAIGNAVVKVVKI